MTSQACLKPLLKSVIDSIFDPSKPDLLDIIYKSTGFRDLIKSGFGYVILFNAVCNITRVSH